MGCADVLHLCSVCFVLFFLVTLIHILSIVISNEEK